VFHLRWHFVDSVSTLTVWLSSAQQLFEVVKSNGTTPQEKEAFNRISIVSVLDLGIRDRPLLCAKRG
jgi:hypothetical protein